MLKLDECDLFLEVGELLRHFKPDEACSDDEHPLAGGGECLDAIHILKVAQGEDARVIEARKRWADR
ncbi:MAG: hypothetical protein BWY82_02071 [Verrucomicrobia bacterium ADurb.Bin474]|nr:MAG: hypothetical protein BWY82_02071 [Verrucomicrobia bacterium ADurb.Bin474]